MNSILHRMSEFLDSAYVPLLAVNAVALVVIFAMGCARLRRLAKGMLWAVLPPNALVVLFLLGALVREVVVMRGKQGAERGMAFGMLLGFSAPLFLEFLLLLAAWDGLRRRAPPPETDQKS